MVVPAATAVFGADDLPAARRTVHDARILGMQAQCHDGRVGAHAVVDAFPGLRITEIGATREVPTLDPVVAQEFPRRRRPDFLSDDHEIRPRLQEKLDFHLNLEQLTERKALFGCGRMVLTHLGREMATRRGQLEAFETADDGMLVKL